MAVQSSGNPVGPVEVCQRVLADRPAFHGYGEMHWDVSVGTLEHLAGLLHPGQRTLEIGLGVSTVVFASNPGGTHTAIGPAPHEFERISDYCGSIGVGLESTTYLHGPSDRMLPSLRGEYDLVLIDGAHAFPFAIVDWHYAGRLLATGGLLVLDDLPIPAVQVLFRYLLTDPGWELVHIVDQRAATFRLVTAVLAGDPWQEQPFNRSYPDSSFLGPRQRLLVAARRRLSRSMALRALLRDRPRVLAFARRVKARILR